jgi:hypothetical protein
MGCVLCLAVPIDTQATLVSGRINCLPKVYALGLLKNTISYGLVGRLSTAEKESKDCCISLNPKEMDAATRG